MSTLILSKRKLSLKTLTVTIGFAALTAMLGTTACAADPEKTLDDQAAQVEATSSEMQQMEVPPPAEEETDAAEEGEDEMSSDESETLPAGTEQETIPAPAPEGTADAENCFTQADGSTECICVTAETCAELLASDTCESETAWQKDDSYGGCTQKQPE